MNKFTFFKASPSYHELELLNLLSDDYKSDLPFNQRNLSKLLNLSLSVTNDYLESLVKQGYLIKEGASTHNVKYYVTSSGEEKRKLLNIELLKSSMNVFNNSKERIIELLDSVIPKTSNNNYLFYGAGEIAELLLQVIKINNYPMNVVAVIDDNNDLIGNDLVGTKIISINNINQYHYDYIIISSYNKRIEINNKLSNNKNIDSNKIVTLFE